MIDNLSLAISHCLLLLAAWRLFSRPDLDKYGPVAPVNEAQPKSRFQQLLKGRGRA